MDHKDRVEQTLYRFLAFLLLACIVSSVYLGWAVFISWVLSAITLMTIFYSATRDNHHGSKSGRGGCRRQ